MKSEELTFKSHSISTTQLPDQSWVASFWRVDGTPMVVSGIFRLIVKTDPHLIKTDAIVDAEVKIDAIIDRRRK